MKRKKVWKATGVLVLAAVLVILASIFYGSYTYNTVEREMNDYVKELAKQNIRIINERIDNDRLYLEGIADSIGARGSALDSPNVLGILEQKTEITRFGRLAVVDLDGKIYYDGKLQGGNVSERLYFKSASKGEAYVEAIIKEEQEKTEVVVAVPILSQGQVRGIVLGEYAMEELQTLMHIDYFGGSGFVYIVKPNGQVLVQGKKDKLNGNSLDDFANDENNTIAQSDVKVITENMKSGKSGSLFYNIVGQKYLMNYDAIGVDDWYLLSTIPKEAVNTRTIDIFTATFYYMCIILSVLGAAALWAFRGFRSNHKRIEDAYKNIQSIYRTVPGAIVSFDIEDECHVQNANEAFYNIIGCSQEAFDSMYGGSFLHAVGDEEKDWFRNLKIGVSVHEFKFICLSGEQKWLLGNFDVERIEGKLLAQAALTDTTRQRDLLTKAESNARMDELTRLKNKRGIDAEFERLLEECNRDGALFILDLDNFKQVNDTFGHLEGDRVLQILADSFREVFRRDDLLGRMGGDEFLVLMCRKTEREFVRKKAEHLIEVFDKRISKENRELGLSVSIGIALSPEDGCEYKILYQKADKALYEAKRGGKKGYRFWEKCSEDGKEV